MSKRDYYDVLGIAKTAAALEIKKAFRKLAMQYHPDRNKAEDAEAKFKEINEAYEILSNPKTKNQYDQFGHAAFQQGGQGGFDFSNFGGGFGNFEGFGGFEDIFSSFFQGASQRPRKGDDYQSQIEITFLESVFGKTITQKLAKYENGVQTKVETEIKIPAGIMGGQSILLRGYGGQGYNDGPSGDLYIVVNVKPHKHFHREGNNIHMKVPVSVFAFINEETLDIKTPYKTEKLHLNTKINSDDTINIQGQGFKSIRRGIYGDLIVHFKMYVPKMSHKEHDQIKKDAAKIKDAQFDKFVKDLK